MAKDVSPCSEQVQDEKKVISLDSHKVGNSYLDLACAHENPRHLVIDSNIWNTIHQKADHLFPNLTLVIVKHANYARTYNPSDRRHLTAPETRSIPDDEDAPMPLEFLCDVDLRGTVSAHTMSRILGTPLKWDYGSRTLTRTIRTVEHVLVRSRGLIEPVRADAPNEDWTPSVPHEDLDVSFETANLSTGVLHAMRYICQFIHPSKETVWGGIKFGADCTLRLSLTGGLQIYHVFTALVSTATVKRLDLTPFPAGRHPHPRPRNQHPHQPRHTRPADPPPRIQRNHAPHRGHLQPRMATHRPCPSRAATTIPMDPVGYLVGPVRRGDA